MSTDLLAGRYAIIEALGQGASGAVYRARDAFTGGQVALKLARGGSTPAWAARREIAALRAVDLPGVVRILDDGITRWEGLDCPFLVMEIVEGAPFPAGPLPWAALEGPTRALLGVLRHLHAVGVVHRDLKPEHVRLLAGGRVVLLDLGLAAGLGADARPLTGAWSAGTPLWMAPEQFLDAEAADPRSDLYAVGLLLYQALSGTPAHPGREAATLRRQRLSAPPTPILQRCPDLPARVARTLDALLARRPDDRPATADATLEALGAGAGAEVEAALTQQRALDPTGGGLRALFAGPDRLFHLAEDAEALLRARAGEEPGALAAELSAWIRDGLATWRGPKIVVSRRELARLRAGLPTRTGQGVQPLARRLAGGDWAGAVEEARTLAATRWRLGDVSGALDAVDHGIRAARAGGWPDVERALLLERVRVAPAGALPELDRTLYELQRALSGDLDGAIALIRALRATRSGQPELAAEALRGVPDFKDEGLDRWRIGAPVEAAQHRGGAAAMDLAVEAAWVWARALGTRTALADVEGWEGLRLSLRDRFDEAAQHHARAAAMKAHASGRLSSLGNQADALLECQDLPGAQAAALALREEARRLRLMGAEARGERILRSAAFRSGRASAVDLELCEAARQLGGFLAGELLFTEAAIAWRLAEHGTASALAVEAARLWSGSRQPAIPLLARALAAATRAPADLDELRGLAAEALEITGRPGLRVQALGVLLWAAPELSEGYRPALEALIAQIPPLLARGRRELMTVDGALSGVEGLARPA